MKTNFFTGIAIVLILLFAGCSGKSNTEKRTVVLNPEIIDLGDIKADKEINIVFELDNTSDEVRKILSKAQSCGCTRLRVGRKTIRPHQKVKVHLTFDPKRESGRFEKSAFLRLDNNDILIFKFRGNAHL